jgi:hypothetical protein
VLSVFVNQPEDWDDSLVDTAIGAEPYLKPMTRLAAFSGVSC